MGRGLLTKYGSLLFVLISAISLLVSGASLNSAAGAVSVSTSRHGGTVRVADMTSYPGFCIVNNPTGTAAGVFRAIYDTLVERNADDGFSPFLAESIVASSSNRTWTIRLRPGIVFHDGTALTSTVLKLNLDSLRGVPSTDIPLNRVTGTINLGFANVMSIEVVDSLTVRVNLELPQIDFLESLYSGGRAGIRGEAQLKSSNCSTTAIGTGPFRLSSFSSSEISLTRNEDYWRVDPFTGDQLPYLENLIFTFVREPSARLDAIVGDGSNPPTADVALFSSIQNPDSITALRQQSLLVNEYSSRSEDLFTVWLNAGKSGSPLINEKARLALAHATDLRRLQRTNFLGLGEVPTSLMPRRSILYTNDGFAEYDLDLARQYVSQFKNETGLSSLSITIPSSITSNDFSLWTSLKAMWAEAGIVLNVIQEQSYEIIAKAFNSTRLGAEQNYYDLVPLVLTFGSESGYNSVFLRSDAYNPNTTNPDFPSDSVHRTKLSTLINLSHQPNRLMDDKLLEAQAQATVKMAGVKYRQAIKHYQQNAYAIPIINGFLSAFASKQIAGFGTGYISAAVPEKFMNAGGPNWAVIYRTSGAVSRDLPVMEMGIVKEVWTGANPQGVVPISNSLAWLSRTEEGEICQISIDSGQTSPCVDVGGRPVGLVANKDKTHGFFLDPENRKVRKLHFFSGAIDDVATIPAVPFAIAVNREMTIGLVTSIASGKVYQLDLSTGQIVNSVSISGGPAGIVLSADENSFWVTQSLLDTVIKLSFEGSLAAHSLSSSGLAKARAVLSSGGQGVTVGARPTGLSISGDGKWLLVANENDDSVSLISTNSSRVSTTLSVSGQPRFLSFGEQATSAFVSGVFSNSIAKIEVPIEEPASPREEPRSESPPQIGQGSTTPVSQVSKPQTPTNLAVKIGKSISSKQLLSSINLVPKPKSKIRLRIAQSSLKVCKVSGLKVRATKRGTCRVVVDVVPPKGKKSVKTISFKVS